MTLILSISHNIDSTARGHTSVPPTYSLKKERKERKDLLGGIKHEKGTEKIDLEKYKKRTNTISSWEAGVKCFH